MRLLRCIPVWWKRNQKTRQRLLSCLTSVFQRWQTLFATFCNRFCYYFLYYWIIECFFFVCNFRSDGWFCMKIVKRARELNWVLPFVRIQMEPKRDKSKLATCALLLDTKFPTKVATYNGGSITFVADYSINSCESVQQYKRNRSAFVQHNLRTFFITRLFCVFFLQFVIKWYET